MSKDLNKDGIVFVIDMIKDFLVPGEEFVIDAGREMYANTAKLLAHARRRKMPIVYAASQGMNNSHLERFWWQIRDGVALNPGTPGVEVVDELRPEKYSEYEVYLPKHKYSSFYGSKLDVILNNPPFAGRRSAIVTGMATNYCCMCTTVDLFNRDYDVYFIDDLNCTFEGCDGLPAETVHKVFVNTIKQGYAVEVLKSHELMKRLSAGEAAVQAA